MISVKQFYAWERSSRETIDFKMIYVDITGDLLAGLLLSQIVYWFTPDRNGKNKLKVIKDKRRWLAKRHSDWHDEIRLTKDQARRALGILYDLGIVDVKRFRFNGSPTTHISLIETRLLQLINQKHESDSDDAGLDADWFGAEAQNELGQSPAPTGPEPRTGWAEAHNINRDYTETTAETTSESEKRAPKKDIPALVSRLRDHGINQLNAEQLAMVHPERCKQQIEWMPMRPQVENPAAYLTKAIRNNYAPPKLKPDRPPEPVEDVENMDPKLRRAREARLRAEQRLARPKSQNQTVKVKAHAI